MKNIIVLLILAVLIGCHAIGNKQSAFVNADQVRKEYEKSKEVTRTKYDGKESSILGKVITINGSDKSLRIHLGNYMSGDLYRIPDITCVVDESDADKFSTVKAGSVIQVKGKFSFGENEIELKSCKKEVL